MSSPRVMFVDDDPLVLWALEMMVRDAKVPWTCEFFSDPGQALDELGKSEWDLLVTDLDMPGLGGIELCRRARSTSPKLQCIALSGGSHGGMQDPELSEFSGYLDKPFASARLLSLIEMTLQSRQ